MSKTADKTTKSRVSDAPLHVTVLRIRNSKTERRQMAKIMEQYNFEENELHLFIWYMGYRLVLVNFLGSSMDDPPADASVRKFIARHTGIH